MIRSLAALLVAAIGLTAPASAQARLNGYLSLDYRKAQAEAAPPLDSIRDPVAGLIVSGEPGRSFAFTLEARTDESLRPSLEQAWASYSFGAALRARVGLYLVPFGRYNEASRAFETLMAHVPLPVSEVYPRGWRDIGAAADGTIGRLSYAAYVGNGLAESADFAGGQQFIDNNAGKGLGARLRYRLTNELEAGGSIYSGSADAAGSRSRRTWGLDAAWNAANFRMAGEYIRAEIENPAPFAAGSCDGYYATAVIRFGPLSPYGGYESVRLDDPFHGLGFGGPDAPGAGLADERRRWTLGVSWSVQTGILLKIEYVWNREPAAARRDDEWRAQAALYF